MGAQILDGPSAMTERRVTDFVYATPGYFEALKFRLLDGRWFNGKDREDASPVALVNEAYARMYFGDDRPVGRHLNLGVPYEIVGLVGSTNNAARRGAVLPRKYIMGCNTG
jgi:hypothetical protein